MSSRFVPAGAASTTLQEDDGWTKARQEVENRQTAKVDQGKQEDGKSLYDVLQANKAAKQEAFEEATKLRNQFRPLDDSEIEFLDSIRENEKIRDSTLKYETAEQIETFRKQRVEAERAAAEAVGPVAEAEQHIAKELWTASRKRRRDNADTGIDASKIKKPSTDLAKPGDVLSHSGSQHREPASVSYSAGASTSKQTTAARALESKPSNMLGLAGYDSDDSDD